MASWILSRASASVSPAEAHPGSSGQTADQLSAMGSCSSTTRNFTFSVYGGRDFGSGWQFASVFVVPNLLAERFGQHPRCFRAPALTILGCRIAPLWKGTVTLSGPSP